MSFMSFVSNQMPDYPVHTDLKKYDSSAGNSKLTRADIVQG